MFDLYYRLVHLVDRSEWDDFVLSYRRPLPITFRFVTADTPAAFRAEGEALLTRWAAVGTGTRRLGEVVDGWQLHLDKHVLRGAPRHTHHRKKSCRVALTVCVCVSLSACVAPQRRSTARRRRRCASG